MRWWFALLLISVSFCAQAQTAIPFSFVQSYTFPVSVTSVEPLPNPWTGGFNAPQLHELDFNRDGINELAVLDRSGNRLSVFETQNNRLSWQCNYSYKKQLPDLHDWFIVRDYNGDGIEDIFCSNYNGIGVYRGLVDASNKLAFEQVSELLYTTYFQNPLNLYVSRADIPAIADVDGDGDLDILTFYILGTCIEYHRNMSRENGYESDSLIFRLESDNWGLITESATDNSINYNDSCGRGGERHSGSSLLVHDLDSDADPDLILGDVSYANPLFLINQPQGNTDLIVPTPQQYPNEIWNQVGVPIFPGLFKLQSDSDTAVDLILAPNTDQGAINNGRTIRRYRSTPGNNFAFTATEEAFICHETIDHGQDSAPALGDIDGDGDLDLAIGNAGAFSNGTYISSLAVYENIGTTISPSFQLLTNDVLNLSAGNHISISPALADLNNDGKADLVLGFYDGTLALHYSDGNFGFLPAAQSTMAIDAGDRACPELFDVNSDGKKDLIVGTKQGRMRLYVNLGTPSSPQFDAAESQWYGSAIETIEEGVSNYGYAAPRFSLFQGDTFLLSGSERGKVFIWNVENAQLTDADSSFQAIDEGAQSTLATGDLNGDGFPDLICGNRAGGLTCYAGQLPMAQPGLSEMPLVRVFPNPAANVLVISGLTEAMEFELIDVSGSQLKRIKLTDAQTQVVALDGIPNGMYALRFSGQNAFFTRKIIVIH